MSRYSYDGSSSASNGGLGDSPYRGQSPNSSPTRFSLNQNNNNNHNNNNNTAKSGVHWRTSSAGATDFKRGTPQRSSNKSKMAEWVVTPQAANSSKF
jgi:hypothetical protein